MSRQEKINIVLDARPRLVPSSNVPQMINLGNMSEKC